jgi:hypothetical protein
MRDGETLRGFTMRSDEPCPSALSLSGQEDIGIYMIATNMVVEDNVIYGFNYGIEVLYNSPRTKRPIIRGNEISVCGEGISAWEVPGYQSPFIEGNHIHDCWDYGIRSQDSNPYIGWNTIEGNGVSGILFVGYSQSLIEGCKIINNGWSGVTADMDYVLHSPCLNCAGDEQTANDVYGNAAYDVYYWEETGLGLLEASVNYWGTHCPDSSRFHGRVDWTPWVDSTHTVRCSDCESCGQATQPTTWGSIKAMFR